MDKRSKHIKHAMFLYLYSTHKNLFVDMGYIFRLLTMISLAVAGHTESKNIFTVFVFKDLKTLEMIRNVLMQIVSLKHPDCHSDTVTCCTKRAV